MNDLSGQTFMLEAVVAVGIRDVRDWRMRCLVSALEEFIIDGVQEEVEGGPGLA